MERLGRHFLWFLLLGIACYTGLILFAQGGKFWTALIAFPLSYIPLLLALAFLNYLLRYFRWQIYLKTLGIRLGSWRSFQIFMAGLTMSITPGKAGEALKAHLLRREGENPWSLGLAVVFVERLTDLMGVTILVALGLNILPVGKGIALLGAAGCLLIFIIVGQPTIFRAIIRLVARLPGMAGRSDGLLEMHRNVNRLLTLRLMLVAVLISTIAWFAECLVLYFALVACRGETNCLQATFVYALSTLAGALSILPGGLVATEGSMTGMLLFFGLTRDTGSLVTFIVRLCTLWFAVFVGMVFLLVLERTDHLKWRVASSEKRCSTPAIERRREGKTQIQDLGGE